MRQFKRYQRLGEQIHRDISQLLERELSEFSSGMLTFTRVKLSDDLRNAQIYYSFLGTDEARNKIVSYLQREKYRIRHKLGKNLRVRHIPEIDFKFDPSIEEGVKIEKLLAEIEDKRDKK